MSLNRGLNACDECYEFVEDCICGKYDPDDLRWQEADYWHDNREDDDAEPQ